MGYDVREVRKALVVKLGAWEDRSGRHPKYKVFDDRGIYLGSTHISHGTKDINNPLLRLMAAQLKIRTSEFIAIIICELERDDYIRLRATSN